MSSIQELADQLEVGSTDLLGCFSSLPELTKAEQLQLVLADQKYRFRRREPTGVENYKLLLPWLTSAPEMQQEIICAEFVLWLGTLPATELLTQFEAKYGRFGEPLQKELRSRIAEWNRMPLDAEHIKAICGRFQEASEAHQVRAIEEYLQLAPVVSQTQLFRELIQIEIRGRQLRDESIDWEHYKRRFPEQLELLGQFAQERSYDTLPPDEVHSYQTTPRDLAGTFISKQTIGDLHNGRYRLERRLGKGAFGEVYLAQDMDLKRQVAIKIPSREALAKLINVESYLIEAQSVASLDHPNIVTVYDVGRTLDGSIYIISKFIDGYSLSDWQKKQVMDFGTIAKMLEWIAGALSHAHQRRLIHRDIKPANILIEEATGLPFVADFGLAIREEEYLQDGLIAGTPAYMSPEQVRGEGHRLDGRSDLYSLGVVMYQLLTGRLPFPAQSYREIAQQITTEEPPAPRTVNKDIPTELERICLKLLSKRASDRYANGQALVDDLAAWLNPQTKQASGRGKQHITPRGLRPFTADDAGFFIDLLPGPRNRDGLPESIGFWKAKIEQRDPDQTFTVGLLYGPSGCGKSSLVKAGLIPNLSPDVIVIYVEATPEDTESRLLRQLRKRLPELPREMGLAASLERIRRGEGPKVVLIVDQFEQWLYAHRVDFDGDFVRALRQCDGGRLQTLLMIRDDFYLVAARLMNHIEVPIVTDQNFRLVDLFDLDHAKRILIRFGQAYEKLSLNASDLSFEQTAFVNRVVTGLAEDEKVVSVRLSLLADMLKGRDWVPATLDEIGGLEGIGISFLEETFASVRADARHRAHQVAVRGVLRALLPSAGSNIKGAMRTEEELLEASGYSQRLHDFRDLLRILDSELRLLTPTYPEGHDVSPVASNQVSSEKQSPNGPTRYYQLTHDYLVPSLREWLVRKQQETKLGRAELRLAERAATWNLYQENKQLPTFIEWLQVRCRTDPLKWTTTENAVMRASTRYHLRRMTLLVATVLLITLGSWFAWQEMRVSGLVETLVKAEPARIPEIVNQLDANSWASARYLAPYLSSESTTPDEQRAQLHARMANVSHDSTLIEPLTEELLVGNVHYILPIRKLLRPSMEKAVGILQTILNDDNAEPDRRFRAALALAEYVSAEDKEVWTESNQAFIVQQLVNSNAEHQPMFRQALHPVSGGLVDDLEKVFGDTTANAGVRLSAANALADYALDDRARLTNLLTIATPEQYAILYPLVSAVGVTETIAQLSEVAATSPTEELGSVSRIAYGQRRANAAVTLLKLGESQKALSVFEWSDDPEALTQFIFRCKPRGIKIETLLDLLVVVTATPEKFPKDARYALLLAIGEYGPSEIPAHRREVLVKQLSDLYANDRSSGVHGASGWVLRHLGEKDIVDRIDQTPVDYSAGREWFTLAIEVRPTVPSETQIEEENDQADEVDSQQAKSKTNETDKSKGNETAVPGIQTEPLPTKTFYYTFVVFQPGEYTIGSVDDEVDRTEDPPLREYRHRVKITRPFAVLDREVTFDEMIYFGPEPYVTWLRQYGMPLNNPCDSVHWYDSVAFCRWLGKELGLSEQDQCYADPQTLNEKDYGRDPQATWAPSNWPLNLEKRGFRLPTEAEWEIAARGQSRTAYGFGSDVAMLERFGWFMDNSGKKTHVGRELRPSIRGLFDIHGNLFEWTHDWFDNYAASAQADPLGPATGAGHVYRGGSWDFYASYSRSANRLNDIPTSRYTSYGFRIAITPTDSAQ